MATAWQLPPIRVINTLAYQRGEHQVHDLLHRYRAQTKNGRAPAKMVRSSPINIW
jgi:hypothetical protein